MQNIDALESLVRDLMMYVEKLQSNFRGAELTADIKTPIKAISELYTKFTNATKTGSDQEIEYTLVTLASHATKLAEFAEKFVDPNIHDIGFAVREHAAEIIKALAPSHWNPEYFDNQGRKALLTDTDSLKAELNNLRREAAEQEIQDRRIRKSINDNDVRISELENRIKQLESAAHSEIQKIANAYVDAKAVIEEKKADIDAILGHVAGRTIAGDYEKSAADEKAMANWLRLGALICMLMIVGVLFSAVLATVGDKFELDKFLSRVSLVFLLSVPAAYLARESAKHREQQYHHLQTSLDMKAISPFLASLPDEAQHKLKADIASRIFGGRDFSKVSNDPYPINTHEIIMKILDKADFSSKPGKAPAKPEKAPKKPLEGASAAPAEPANQ